MKRILFIVSRNQTDLVERLEQECRGRTVVIVVDRRFSERRKNSQPYRPPERRLSVRRVLTLSELELIGLAVVVVS